MANIETVGELKTQEYVLRFKKPIDEYKMLDLQHYEELSIKNGEDFTYGDFLSLVGHTETYIIEQTYRKFIKPLYIKACKVLEPLQDIVLHVIHSGTPTNYSHKSIIKHELKTVFENEYFITNEEVLQYYNTIKKSERQDIVRSWRLKYGG